ncbi:class I SAM-dependent methyltransferase [Lewinella sp. 4G2]|uniref:class I SAM-dependent DNA methyltransferase n=1 Tax=Lewinella sp. 4G2 TaxID=1803372 RepID=UPI0007B4CC8E|nr:class I SAM-dependent methyltransferase [Lewinella sp. 4G2]OAV44937.1 hypothetical protein A3850_010715 [Lewinella sp. 4G2]
MVPSVQSYYDQLAPTYDHNRFGNSYGRYLHWQEENILKRYLSPPEHDQVLDLACGTGRFMHHCSVGLDLSPEMIAVARRKFPEKDFTVANALRTPFTEDSFDAIISFHLLMHLQPEDLRAFCAEGYRLLRHGGRLIFDLPSAERRTLLRRRQNHWHGANAFTHADVTEVLGDRWRILTTRGIAVFPVHRIPRRLRPTLRSLDSWLGKTPLARAASYRVYVIEKI